MHTVAIVVFDGVVATDFATPLDLFSHATSPDDSPCYRTMICSESGVVQSRGFGIQAQGGISDLANADTLIIPGFYDLNERISPTLIAAIQNTSSRGARVASICTGAFILAESGLLEGKPATTHWAAADELKRRYPRIDVKSDVLFVDNGRILTSAGASAGHDLALHMIRADFGERIAADSARMAVMSFERPANQLQRPVPHPNYRNSRQLMIVVNWIEENLSSPITLDEMASHAAMSRSTIARHFIRHFGTTPYQWVVIRRVRRAQELLESTSMSIGRISVETGLGSPQLLKRHFQRIIGMTPGEYRRAFSHDARQVNDHIDIDLIEHKFRVAQTMTSHDSVVTG